jgi:hypothetical protein
MDLDSDVQILYGKLLECCDTSITFYETAPCLRDVFECAGDKEMEESIFVDKGLRALTVMKMNHYSPTSSSEHVPASTLEEVSSGYYLLCLHSSSRGITG